MTKMILLEPYFTSTNYNISNYSVKLLDFFCNMSNWREKTTKMKKIVASEIIVGVMNWPFNYRWLVLKLLITLKSLNIFSVYILGQKRNAAYKD